MDKIKGMLYGLILGDALGAPHEFKSSKKNYTGTLEFRALLPSRFQGNRYLAVGQFTDDSEMSITLLRSILRNNGYNKNDVILSYMNWANSTPILGTNTRELFKGIKTIKGYENRYNKKFDTEEKRENSQSNGSLMRCSPLALLKNYKKACREDVYITNPSQTNLEVELIYLKCIRMGLKNKNVKDIWEYAKNEISDDLYEDIINENRDIKENKGWVLHAFYCAMLCLRKMAKGDISISNLLDDIILMYGDCDTNAAIAGTLIGSIIGYDSFDERSKNNINIIKNYMDGDYDTDIEREDKYMLKDIDELVEKAYDMINQE